MRIVTVKLRVRGIVFDLYGTVVDVGAVTEACKEITPDPLAFNNQWRAKQLEYTFLRTLMGRYRDFWKVTEEALGFAIQRFGIQVTSEQRRYLMDAWLHPTPYPEVVTAMPRLKEKYLLAVLSNGNAKMLRKGLDHTGLRSYFQWIMSADAIKCYKPSPEVYQLAVKQMRLNESQILFVSSNSWSVGSIELALRWIPSASDLIC